MHTVGFAETVRDLLQVRPGLDPRHREPAASLLLLHPIWTRPSAPLSNLPIRNQSYSLKAMGDHDKEGPFPEVPCMLPLGPNCPGPSSCDLGAGRGLLAEELFEFVFSCERAARKRGESRLRRLGTRSKGSTQPGLFPSPRSTAPPSWTPSMTSASSAWSLSPCCWPSPWLAWSGSPR